MRPYNENEQQQLSFSERVGLLAAILTTIGDGLAVLAAAAAIEEGWISEQEQQQKIEDLQSQIDDLKQEQDKAQVLEEKLDALMEMMGNGDGEQVGNAKFDVKKSSDR